MILSCSNISKSFGENDILKQVSFHIEDHEKAGDRRHQWRRKIHSFKGTYRGTGRR